MFLTMRRHLLGDAPRREHSTRGHMMKEHEAKITRHGVKSTESNMDG